MVVAHSDAAHPTKPTNERLKWKERASAGVKRAWPGILNPSKGD